MSGEGIDDDRATDEGADGSDSFFEGVRDAHLRPDGGRAGGEGSRSGGPADATDGRVPGATTGNRPRSGTESRSRARTRGRYRHHLQPTLDESCPTTPAIREASALGTLAHVGPATEGRFGIRRRVRHTTTEDIARRVEVRACRVPDAERDGFADALAGQLHRWTAVDAVDGVVPVVDRGGDERPWVVTASTGPTLCGRETPSVSRGLGQAARLARVLAELHERGVVHAGIDPGNVVLTVGSDGRPEPAFYNVGLVDVYRRYEDPAAVLDPRYAAPEYFEADRGVVDRATDVYGLGVVCFRLLTGVAPVTGSAETIAERVTDDEPLPRPSRVDPRLPEGIDDVILTATATDKFERFETARAFHEALVDLIEDA